MKQTIRLSEPDLHKIIKESVSRILNEANNIEIVEGSFGTITYLELFDYTDFQGRFPYIVEYSNKAYYYPIKDSYLLKRPTKSKGFKTHKECLDFCKENSIKIVNEFNVKNSLLKGMTGTRSIKPESDNIEIVEGSFGTITYRELFDYLDEPGRFPYSLEYSNKAYHNQITDNYQLKDPTECKGFKTRKECLNFCQENSIKIVKEFKIKHSLSKGMPDTRSIKPWSHPKDFS